MPENFILELKLDYNKTEEEYLNKVFWYAKNIYNAQLHIIENRYKELAKTKKYRKLMYELNILYNMIKDITDKLNFLKRYKSILGKDKEYKLYVKEKKEKLYKAKNLETTINKKRVNLIQNLGISEYDLQKQMKKFSKQYSTFITSTVLQKIATQLSKSLQKSIYKYNPKFRHKNIKNFTSIEGKDNKNGIVFDLENMKVKIGSKKSKRYKEIDVNKNLTKYEKECLKSKICYCRIVRKDNIRGKSKYFLQLTLKGKVYIKENKNSNIKGNVGIDTGTTTMAVCSNNEVLFVNLAKKAKSVEKRIEELQSYIDKSKKQTNPNKYTDKGTYKKTKDKWVYSNRCKKAIIKLRDLQRKQKVYRKEEHCKLADKIIKMGDVISIEPISYKSLAKRRKTSENETKKGFGRSVNLCAPSSFLTILKNKTININKTYLEIDTKKCKASQYRHDIDSFEKVDLDVRVKEIGNYKVQRDLYSAFLIMNVNEELDKIDKEKCDKTFSKFIENQEKEIKRLRETKEDQSNNFGLNEFL